MNRHNSTLRPGKGFRKLSFEEAKDRLRSKRNLPVSRYGLKRKRLGKGRRSKEWDRVWRWLKTRLERAGRTCCEFAFIPHECSGILTPAHSKKRRLMVGMDIYSVAIACSVAHRILDEDMSHSEMEKAVLRAIQSNGGLILPEAKAA